MQKQAPDILNHTIAFWNVRSGQEFSQEEAREMVANVSGFFTVLAEWERRAKAEHLEKKEVNPKCCGKEDSSPGMQKSPKTAHPSGAN
jgi:hypothetical protein